MTTSPHLRPLTVADRALLVTATTLNVNWGEERFVEADVEAAAALRHYCDLVPRRGDWGCVAEIDAEPVGVAWALFLDSADPGYGYVGAGIPELSICVRPPWRGRGVGRLLMAGVLAEAPERAPSGICLSVEPGNGVRAWYEREGFAPVAEADPGTLLRA